MKITALQRVFKFKSSNEDVELVDPNPLWPLKEVIKFYASQYPDIIYINDTTPGVIEPDEKSGNDVMVYNLQSKPGDHG